MPRCWVILLSEIPNLEMQGCQCPEVQLSTVGDPISPGWSLGEEGYSGHPSEVPRQDAATDAHSSRPNSSLLCWLFLEKIEGAETLNNYLIIVVKVPGFKLRVSFSCSVLPSVPLAKTNIINILIRLILVLPTPHYWACASREAQRFLYVITLILTGTPWGEVYYTVWKIKYTGGKTFAKLECRESGTQVCLSAESCIFYFSSRKSFLIY